MNLYANVSWHANSTLGHVLKYQNEKNIPCNLSFRHFIEWPSHDTKRLCGRYVVVLAEYQPISISCGGGDGVNMMEP